MQYCEFDYFCFLPVSIKFNSFTFGLFIFSKVLKMFPSSRCTGYFIYFLLLVVIIRFMLSFVWVFSVWRVSSWYSTFFLWSNDCSYSLRRWSINLSVLQSLFLDSATCLHWMQIYAKLFSDRNRNLPKALQVMTQNHFHSVSVMLWKHQIKGFYFLFRSQRHLFFFTLFYKQ